MSVRGLSGYTLSWVQQSAQLKSKTDTFTQDKARQSTNELQILENENQPQEFSKDDLKRLREFMSKIGEGVNSIDGVIRDFERIDTRRAGKITAEQVKEFESITAEAEAAAAAQPIMLDQGDASAAYPVPGGASPGLCRDGSRAHGKLHQQVHCEDPGENFDIRAQRIITIWERLILWSTNLQEGQIRTGSPPLGSGSGRTTAP